MTYPTKKIGDVVELQYGKGIDSSQRNEHGDVPIYGANGVLGWTDKVWTTGKAIILGRKGSAGELTRVSGKFWPSDVTYYVLGNNQIDIDYLFHFLESVNLPKLATGVKPGINRNRVYEIEIPVPPIVEQRKIVEKIEKQLAKIDEVARLRAEAQALAEKLLPAALHEVFSSAASKGWEEKELGEICTLVNGRAFKSSEWQKSGQYPIIRIQNLNNTKSGGFNYFSGKADHKIIVKEGDLLFSWSGSRGTSFGPHIWNGKTGALNQHIFKVEHSGNIDRGYFYQALKMLVTIVEENLHGGAGLVHITKSKLQRLKIPLPPLAEQKKIVKKLDTLTDKARALRALQSSQSADLKSLKQSVLHEAFAM